MLTACQLLANCLSLTALLEWVVYNCPSLPERAEWLGGDDGELNVAVDAGPLRGEPHLDVLVVRGHRPRHRREPLAEVTVGGLDAQHLHPGVLGRHEGEPDDAVAADRILRGLVQAGVRPEPGLHRHGVEVVPDGAAVLVVEIKTNLRED